LLRRLATEIYPLLANHAAIYYELFAGSAAVFFALRSLGLTTEMILADKIMQLLWFYQNLRSHPAELFSEIHGLLDSEQELMPTERREMSLDVRKQFNQDKKQCSALQSARFLYLNYRGFNGLYRENQAGEYTVAYGGPREYFPSPETLLRASRSLHNTGTAFGYDGIPERHYNPGDVVFADPPYDGTYTGYAGGFSAEDQARLAAHLRSLSERSGVHVFATNSDTPLIRDLYQWAQIEVLTTRYNVGGKRERVNEVLIRGRK
jgi:DNA adenine methylase